MASIWKPKVGNSLGYRLFALKTGYIIKKPYGSFDYIVHIVLFSCLSYHFLQRSPIEYNSITNNTLFITALLLGHTLLDRFILGVSVYINVKKNVAMSGSNYQRIKLQDFRVMNDEVGGTPCLFGSFENQNSSEATREILWLGEDSNKVGQLLNEEIAKKV